MLYVDWCSEKTDAAAGGAPTAGKGLRSTPPTINHFCEIKVSAVTSTSTGSPSKVETVYAAHYGPIVDLERSPFFDDIVLSIGGGYFSIWREGFHVCDGC